MSKKHKSSVPLVFYIEIERSVIFLYLIIFVLWQIYYKQKDKMFVA